MQYKKITELPNEIAQLHIHIRLKKDLYKANKAIYNIDNKQVFWYDIDIEIILSFKMIVLYKEVIK